MAKRTGYGTPYWVDSKNNVADFTTGVTINKDMVFSCVYPPVAPKAQFNVTFENINGSTFTTTKVYDGDFANDPGIPTDMDTIKQDFVKWVYKSDNSKGLNDVTITDNSVVFVPVVQNKHKVEFKLNGSLINASTIYVSDGQYATYPGAIPVPSDTTKVFDKWVVEGKSDDISSTPITSDTVFVAQFKDKPTLPSGSSKVTLHIVNAPSGNNLVQFNNDSTCKPDFEVKQGNVTIVNRIQDWSGCILAGRLTSNTDYDFYFYSDKLIFNVAYKNTMTFVNNGTDYEVWFVNDQLTDVNPN